MMVLMVILVDAMVEQIAQTSVLGTNHWVALRVFDLILSL